DVEISVESSSMSPIKVAALAHSSLRCDWRPTEDGGTCHGLLHSDGTHLEGELALAPYVQALHDSGIQLVYVTLVATGHPAAVSSPLSRWIKKGHSSRVRSRRSAPDSYYFVSAIADQKPAAFVVDSGERWQPMRLGWRLLFVLGGPALLALWIRRRDKRR